MKFLMWLILAPILLVILGFIGTELNKAYWDSRVREMCESEGGITVYETVQLSREEYIEYGGIDGTIPVPNENSSQGTNFPFFASRKRSDIRNGYPEVWTNETIIYRKADAKELGRYVTFTRRGGDFPSGIAAASSFSCRDVSGFRTDFEKQIFTIQGE